MVRVLQITDKAPGGGGIFQAVETQADLLKRRGHEVSRFTLGGQDHPIVVRRKLPENHPLLQALAKAASQTDLIMLHLGFSTLSPDFIRHAKTHAPLVACLHDVSPFSVTTLSDGLRSAAGVVKLMRSPLRRQVLTVLKECADVFVAPSAFLEEMGRANGMRRFDVIPHAIAPHDSDGLPSEQGLVVLYVGLLSRPKGVWLLLDAFARIKTVGVALRIVGDGPDRHALEKTVRTMGLSDQVTFLGQQAPETVRLEMSRCRVLAHPSLVDEGFGLVGPEALQQARPVVSFATGGAQSWLHHDVTGLHVAPRTPDAFANALDLLLTDDARADRLGLGGRDYVARTHAPDRIADLWDQLCQNEAGCPA